MFSFTILETNNESYFKVKHGYKKNIFLNITTCKRTSSSLCYQNKGKLLNLDQFLKEILRLSVLKQPQYSHIQMQVIYILEGWSKLDILWMVLSIAFSLTCQTRIFIKDWLNNNWWTNLIKLKIANLWLVLMKTNIKLILF